MVIITIMVILIILFLVSKTQSFMTLQSIYHQMTTENYQNFLAKDLKDQCIEDYTTRCLFHYNYIKNHYRLIAVDLSRQKELDTDPKAILQMEFVG